MKTRRSRDTRHRFPPDIISHAVWLYYQFNLSFRDVEDLLAERGVTVTYETIRRWCTKFGAQYARRLRRRQGRLGGTWYLDELFVTINGERHYLWRAVDQDGDVIDILVQGRRDARAARRFFRTLLKSQRRKPFRIVTDRLGSYRVAHRRECLDRTLFWSASDLEGKLFDFAVFYNESRTHTSLAGKPPGGNPARVASVTQYGWRAHCRGLYPTPIAA